MCKNFLQRQHIDISSHTDTILSIIPHFHTSMHQTVRRIADFTKAAEKAKEVRSENYINSAAIDLTELVQNYGLDVVEIDFGEKFSNIAGYIKESIIYVSASDSANRKRFTIAHEFGHFLLHKTQLKEAPGKYAVLFRIPLGTMNADPIEQEANCFAANLLVPEELLIQFQHDGKTISELAKIFEVSQDVIGFRVQSITASHNS